jgi:hypothetical protein
MARRYWIMDHDTTPQRFPLRRLLRRINEVAGHGVRTFQVLKAQGYERRIFDLSAQLELNESVTVDLSDLDELCGGVDEWFYDLDVQIAEYPMTTVPRAWSFVRSKERTRMTASDQLYSEQCHSTLPMARSGREYAARMTYEQSPARAPLCLTSLAGLRHHEAEIVQRIGAFPNGGRLLLLDAQRLLRDVGVELTTECVAQCGEAYPELLARSGREHVYEVVAKSKPDAIVVNIIGLFEKRAES